MWLVYAAVSMLCFAGMQLLLKQLTRMGLATPVILVFVFAFGGFLYLGHVAVARLPMELTARGLGLLLAAAVFSYGGNLYMVRGLAHAPNPGYALAIVGLQALPVTLASILLFGAELSWTKALGVVLSVVGVALLMLEG